MHAYSVLMVPADCWYREYKQVVPPGHASASKYFLFSFLFPFLCLIVKHRIKHCVTEFLQRCLQSSQMMDTFSSHRNNCCLQGSSGGHLMQTPAPTLAISNAGARQPRLFHWVMKMAGDGDVTATLVILFSLNNVFSLMPILKLTSHNVWPLAFVIVYHWQQSLASSSS